MPDLPDVLDLTIPRVTDAELWEILAQLLREFREYKSGPDIQCVADTEEPGTLLGDLFKRAFELKIGILESQARIGLRELAAIEAGAPITVKVVHALWGKGGDGELQATRIAWECRDVEASGWLLMSTRAGRNGVCKRGIGHSNGRHGSLSFACWFRPRTAKSP